MGVPEFNCTYRAYAAWVALMCAMLSLLTGSADIGDSGCDTIRRLHGEKCSQGIVFFVYCLSSAGSPRRGMSSSVLFDSTTGSTKVLRLEISR